MDNSSEEEKINVLSSHSEKRGMAGLLETFLRRFRTLSFMVLLVPIQILCLFIMALSMTPSVYLFKYLVQITSGSGLWWESFAMGVGIAFGYFFYGLVLIVLVPLVNYLLPFRVKPWRGSWHSNQTVPWYIHNALTYVVRFTFLEFITPSPLNIFFFRAMGMKIGKGVVINTTNISDPCLIEIEDYVTIGGSVSIMAHYGQKGFLVLAPVRIKKGANLGLKSSVMGGAVIGEKAFVKPHSVVMPKQEVKHGEVV